MNNCFRIILVIVCALAMDMRAQTMLTLDECISDARRYNRQLQNVALDIGSARELRDEAYANYFPQVLANIAAFRLFDEIAIGDGMFAAGVSAVQPIYAGGQITGANRLAKVQQDVSYLKQSLTEKDVVQKVTENFWQIAQVKYNLATVAAAAKQVDEVYRQVEQFVTAGVVTRNDLIRVKLRQKEIASSRVKLENAERLMLLLLAQQIGRANDSIDIVLSDSSIVGVETALASCDVSALMQREEVLLAAKNVEACQLQMKVERAKLLPSLSVGVMGIYNKVQNMPMQMSQMFGGDDIKNGLVFGMVSIPVSSLWTNNHSVRRKKLALKQAQNDYLDIQEKIRIDIETAWCNLDEASRQVEISRTAVEESAENLRISMDQYRAGTITLTDILDAETLHRKSQDSLSSDIATYHIRLSDYCRKTR